MDSVPLYQGNSIFRNQPPYTLFNKTFEEAKDVLFLQIEEINPIFLTEAQQKNTVGFSQKVLLDPRTKKEQIKIEYDHSTKGKRQRTFKGGGIKSALTKEQHKLGLAVLLAQQQRQPLDEADSIVWHKFQTKLQKERRQMQEYIRDFEEAHKEEIHAPAKRFDELYRDWFTKQRDLYARLYPDKLAYNTHTGLPLVNLCKTINDDPVHLTGVELLFKQGYVRLYREDFETDLQNLNFRLNEFANSYNECQHIAGKAEMTDEINRQLLSSDDQCTGQSFCIPLETLLFLLTAGDIDLPTEVLLEIQNSSSVADGKIITFESPLPAHHCGYHTRQKVVQQCFLAFMSHRGRAEWLTLKKDEVNIEKENVKELYAGGINLTKYAPVKFEDYLAENEAHFNTPEEELVKRNTALLKCYLKSPDSDVGLKILTTLQLPPALDVKANKFLACEFIKLESKPQFGCELFTKQELLSAWLQMRLLSFVGGSNYGVCYRLSTNNFHLQLKQQLTIDQIEHALMQQHRIDPNQLLANLAEFLKLLSNMPAGRFMLRYSPKYADKFLLCMTSQEITQNTLFLHGLLETEPTNLAWMTQQSFLPISETLCGAVHLDNKILPCAFLPLLPGQKNLETADTKMKRRKNFIAKITSQKENNLKEKKLKAHKKAQKRQRRKMKAKGPKEARVAETKEIVEEDLCRF